MLLIRNNAEFHQSVGDRFTLFCGSYISAMNRFAPTVDVVRKGLLEALRTRLSAGPDVAARFVASEVMKCVNMGERKATFIEPSAVRMAINKIKFEELIRHLANLHHDIQFTDNLISSIFGSGKQGFNENHHAIAILLQLGVCQNVITTNFDTGIENACRYIGFVPVVITQRHLHMDLPTHGVIYKLHGCADKGNVIANSTLLYRMFETEAYKTLGRMIGERPCIFLGYSGVGDIDIAPYFRRSKIINQLIWTNYVSTGNPFHGSKTAVGDLLCHAHDKNLLLSLAHSVGVRECVAEPSADYRPVLDKFLFANVDPLYAVDAFLDLAGLYNPDIHAAYWYARGRSNFIRSERAMEKEPRMLAIPLNGECKLELAQYGKNSLLDRVWRPFIEWRIGDNIKALAMLHPLLRIRFGTRDEKRAVVKALNISLGILVEMLWCTPLRKRPSLIESSGELRLACRELPNESWWVEAEGVDEMVNRRKKMIELEFHESGNCAFAENNISKLFYLCMDLELFNQAITIIHTSWLINRSLGNRLYAESNKGGGMGIPSAMLISVRKKNFSHRYYNSVIFGRWLFIFSERGLPRLAEFVWAWQFRRMGKLVLAELSAYEKMIS
jgi:SIR2-like domain